MKDVMVYADLAGAARDWIADCGWADLDTDGAAELTDAEVLRGVERHYEGGLRAFAADGAW